MPNPIRIYNPDMHLNVIRVSDGILYPTRVDLLNAIGAPCAYAPQGGTLVLRNDNQRPQRKLWFPVMAQSRDNWDDRWNNYAPDEEHIEERCCKNINENLNDDWKRRRTAFVRGYPDRFLVYAKLQKCYMFWGVYEVERLDYTHRPYCTYWKRIATEVETIPLP